LSLRFFDEVDNGKRIFQGSVHSYLHGLPNASQPTAVRCLEIAIKEKYRREENEEPSDNLKNLIDWSGDHLGAYTEIQQGLRLMRNYIHENKLVKEVDALESIRHTAEFLNKLFPPPQEEVEYEHNCLYCESSFMGTRKPKELILGYEMEKKCTNCNKINGYRFLGSSW